ncbi:7-cyano-7-deazaguanine synthase [Candidatus Woesearchaeota archaeon]|nr:7-cyano-7-deazaguanine synthase [Candidatus Woesearchaeota archaeon]
MEKGVALLSGGIDSPVAIHLLQNRLEIIAVHFHQQPLTGPEELDKVKKLVKVLGVQKTYLIPFVDVLKEIVSACGHKNYFVLSKILMMKTASTVAEREGAQYLITGENLAQVSSQTLSNLTVITQNVGMEIFRPVLTYDKQEIIEVAKKIGTYEISKGPEICNLLGPKHPATKSNPAEIGKELAKLDIPRLMDESLKKVEIIGF